jgi:hypothetical protein
MAADPKAKPTRQRSVFFRANLRSSNMVEQPVALADMLTRGCPGSDVLDRV